MVLCRNDAQKCAEMCRKAEMIYPVSPEWREGRLMILRIVPHPIKRFEF